MSPRTFEIRRLKTEDASTFTALIELFNIVFEEDSRVGSAAHLTKILSDEHFLALAALIDGRVVAGLTAYELPSYYSDSSEIFLYDLAVQPEYQRMGVGKALLQNLSDYCHENGIPIFFVLAHTEDQNAVEFYRSTGGKGEAVANFIYEIGEK